MQKSNDTALNHGPLMNGDEGSAASVAATKLDERVGERFVIRSPGLLNVPIPAGQGRARTALRVVEQRLIDLSPRRQARQEKELEAR